MTDHPEDPKEIWVICYTSRYGNRIAWGIHDTEEEARAALVDEKVYPPWQEATLRHYVLDERPAAKPKVGRRKG